MAKKSIQKRKVSAPATSNDDAPSLPTNGSEKSPEDVVYLSLGEAPYDYYREEWAKFPVNNSRWLLARLEQTIHVVGYLHDLLGRDAEHREDAELHGTVVRYQHLEQRHRSGITQAITLLLSDADLNFERLRSSSIGDA